MLFLIILITSCTSERSACDCHQTLQDLAKKKADGGMINQVSQERKKVSSFKQGGIAKGCGGVMENRRKVTKRL